MKTIVILFVALFSVFLPAYAGDNSLEKFISNPETCVKTMY